MPWASATPVDGVSLCLLRSQESRSAHCGAGRGQAGAFQSPCDPEVQHPGAILGHDDVAWFQVAVNESAGVNGLQCLGEGSSESAERLLAHWLTWGEQLGQCRARYVGGGKPRRFRVRVGIHYRRRVESAHLPGCGH